MIGDSPIPESYMGCFKCIELAAKETSTAYMLVGATARDLLFESAGIKSQRLTYDIDISLSVDSWASFEQFKSSLVRQGFKTTPNSQQRLSYVNPMVSESLDKVLLDVVPHGGVNDQNSDINWPPDGAIKMCVFGFQEAYENRLDLTPQPGLTIPVVSVPGLCLLKLVAWLDRPSNIRTKDALDIKFLLSNYELLNDIRESVFKEGFAEQQNFDLDNACAAKLGNDVRTISSDSTTEFLHSKLFDTANEPTLEQFVMEMSNRDETQVKQNYQIIAAFRDGYMNQNN